MGVVPAGPHPADQMGNDTSLRFLQGKEIDPRFIAVEDPTRAVFVRGKQRDQRLNPKNFRMVSKNAGFSGQQSVI